MLGVYIDDNFRRSCISKQWKEAVVIQSRLKPCICLERTEESIEKLNQGFGQIEIDSPVIQAA